MIRSHMAEICRELLKQHTPIEQILGCTDSRKLRSSMTLFWLATGETIFKEVLDQFFDGNMDPFTKEKFG